MRKIIIKAIPGDGVGIEVLGESLRVLSTLEQCHAGARFEVDTLDWGCGYYLRHGSMMPPDGLEVLKDCDSILLGAIGFPGVPDHVSVGGLLLPIRREFDQYVNIRPVKLLDGLDSPLKLTGGHAIDFVVLRENSEGEYCGRGSIRNEGGPDEAVVQESWFTRTGVSRIIRYAFEYAAAQDLGSVVSATKSNALNYSMVYWDKIFDEIRHEYPQIHARSIYVDALAGFFVLKPHEFEVVVASNLFGDILTDLGSALLGSIGISPSANINPEKRYPSMFEPIHGSAPDIAGTGVANPVGMIWSMAMMLKHLELPEMEQLLMQALGDVLGTRQARTPDLGGTSTTKEVVDEVCTRIEVLARP
ncbi:MAG TPA: tartrate dehydrogenase [Deltaproteobacteria bacterium]|nr:tartrate dehydrogenase [Deltaproteobacteria bacterium]